MEEKKVLLPTPRSSGSRPAVNAPRGTREAFRAIGESSKPVGVPHGGVLGPLPISSFFRQRLTQTSASGTFF